MIKTEARNVQGEPRLFFSARKQMNAYKQTNKTHIDHIDEGVSKGHMSIIMRKTSDEFQ